MRDSSLISIDASGLVRVLRRGSGTWVVATRRRQERQRARDGARGRTIDCARPRRRPSTLAIGQVVTDVSGQGFCVHASGAGAEYAIVPFYNSGVPSATITVDVRGQGLTSLPIPASSLLPLRVSSVPVAAAEPASRRTTPSRCGCASGSATPA